MAALSETPLRSYSAAHLVSGIGLDIHASRSMASLSRLMALSAGQWKKST